MNSRKRRDFAVRTSSACCAAHSQLRCSGSSSKVSYGGRKGRFCSFAARETRYRSPERFLPVRQGYLLRPLQELGIMATEAEGIDVPLLDAVAPTRTRSAQSR